MGLRPMFRSRRHGLFRATRSALERGKAHVGSIVQEFACQVVSGHRLERFPDTLVKSDIHPWMGSSDLVCNVVPGDFLLDLLVPELDTKGRTNHRSDVVADECH